jgi:hypothetical protein
MVAAFSQAVMGTVNEASSQTRLSATKKNSVIPMPQSARSDLPETAEK